MNEVSKSIVLIAIQSLLLMIYQDVCGYGWSWGIANGGGGVF